VAGATVNRTTGRLLDGHLRVELAIAAGEASVPVTYVELTEEEERLVLASFDPLGAMATADARRLEDLLASLKPSDDALREMLSGLAEQHRIGRRRLVDPDQTPLLPGGADLYVRPGELWRLGEHFLDNAHFGMLGEGLLRASPDQLERQDAVRRHDHDDLLPLLWVTWANMYLPPLWSLKSGTTRRAAPEPRSPPSHPKASFVRDIGCGHRRTGMRSRAAPGPPR
jgi:hypothetical protein